MPAPHRLAHAASWAARFLFTGEQLVQPVGRLSGGEQARAEIAHLMLQPADVLLLNEPTTDLNIPALDQLEFIAGHWSRCAASARRAREMDAAQQELNALYMRWGVLDAKSR